MIDVRNIVPNLKDCGFLMINQFLHPSIYISFGIKFISYKYSSLLLYSVFFLEVFFCQNYGIYERYSL